MTYTDYAYKKGTVGLYTINEILRSIVLFYPLNTLLAVEKEFILQDTLVITVPYNTYLDQIGKLPIMPLN